ncbi:MAG: hypothetical protein SGPRY_006808 [Prymnesium sp.]
MECADLLAIFGQLGPLVPVSTTDDSQGADAFFQQAVLNVPDAENEGSSLAEQYDLPLFPPIGEVATPRTTSHCHKRTGITTPKRTRRSAASKATPAPGDVRKCRSQRGDGKEAVWAPFAIKSSKKLRRIADEGKKIAGRSTLPKFKRWLERLRRCATEGEELGMVPRLRATVRVREGRGGERRVDREGRGRRNADDCDEGLGAVGGEGGRTSHRQPELGGTTQGPVHDGQSDETVSICSLESDFERPDANDDQTACNPRSPSPSFRARTRCPWMQKRVGPSYGKRVHQCERGPMDGSVNKPGGWKGRASHREAEIGETTQGPVHAGQRDQELSNCSQESSIGGLDATCDQTAKLNAWMQKQVGPSNGTKFHRGQFVFGAVDGSVNNPGRDDLRPHLICHVEEAYTLYHIITQGDRGRMDLLIRRFDLNTCHRKLRCLSDAEAISWLGESVKQEMERTMETEGCHRSEAPSFLQAV